MSDLEVKQKIKVKPPRLYDVIFLNDDVTPMDFVVDILKVHFNHTAEEAYYIMMSIHERGRGVAGTYHKEVAESKALQVTDVASRNGYPLRVKIEPQ